MALHALTRRTVGGLIIVLISAVLSAGTAPALPEQMTTQWNAAGAADGTMSKPAVLVGGPSLVLGIVLLFESIPRIDPLAENIDSFQTAYDAAAILVAGFLAYVHGFVVAWNLGYEISVQQALSPALAVLYVAVGFLMEHAERNWFVGIRTPWTLSSEAVWRHTHDRTAILFKIAGAVALGGLVVPAYFVYFVAVPAAAIALFATVYSYLDYRRVVNGEQSGMP
jgi:uncharacterized membrane protein